MHSIFRSAKSSKFGFEEGNSARCFRKHSVDRFMNNLSVRGAATLKSEVYSGTGLHPHFCATTETTQRYPCEYCAIFYPGVVDSLDQDLAWRRDFKQSTSSICGETEVCDIADEEDNLNESMFIGIVNISEERQRRIPRFIWLQTLNDCTLIVGESNPLASDTLGTCGSDIR
jgi:hypothetical protein